MTSRSTIDIIPGSASRAAYPKTVVIPRSKDGGFGFTVRHYIPYTYDERAEQLVPAGVGGTGSPSPSSNTDVTTGFSWCPPSTSAAAATVPVYTTGEPSTAAGAVMFQPEPISNTVYVLFVQPGGTAERAGLHEGDRIASVNGRQVSGRTYSQVIQLIKESGSMLELVIEPNDNNNENNNPNSVPWSRDITTRQRTLSPYYARLQRQLSRSAATAPLPYISDTASFLSDTQPQQQQQFYRQPVLYQSRQHPSAPVGGTTSTGGILQQHQQQQNISEASSYVSLNSSSSSAVTAVSGGSSTITTINLNTNSSNNNKNNNNRPTSAPTREQHLQQTSMQQSQQQQQVFHHRSPSPSMQRSFHHPSEFKQQQQHQPTPPPVSPRPQHHTSFQQQQLRGMPSSLTDSARTSSLISLNNAAAQQQHGGSRQHPLKAVAERRDSKTMFAGLRLASVSLSSINDAGIANDGSNNDNSPGGGATNISPTRTTAGDLHSGSPQQQQHHRRLQQSDSAATASSLTPQLQRVIRPLSHHSWTQPIAALPPGMRSSGAYALRTRTDGALPMPIGGIAYGGMQSPPPFATERGRSPTPDTTTTATTLSSTTSSYAHAHPSFAGRRTLQHQQQFQRQDSANLPQQQQQQYGSMSLADDTDPPTEPLTNQQQRPALEKWKLYNSYPKPYPGGGISASSSVASPPPPVYQQQHSNIYSSSSVDSLLSNRDQQYQMPSQNIASNVRSASTAAASSQRTTFDYNTYSPDIPREQQQQQRYGSSRINSPPHQGMLVSASQRTQSSMTLPTPYSESTSGRTPMSGAISNEQLWSTPSQAQMQQQQQQRSSGGKQISIAGTRITLPPDSASSQHFVTDRLRQFERTSTAPLPQVSASTGRSAMSPADSVAASHANVGSGVLASPSSPASDGSSSSPTTTTPTSTPTHAAYSERQQQYGVKSPSPQPTSTYRYYNSQRSLASDIGGNMSARQESFNTAAPFKAAYTTSASTLPAVLSASALKSALPTRSAVTGGKESAAAIRQAVEKGVPQHQTCSKVPYQCSYNYYYCHQHYYFSPQATHFSPPLSTTTNSAIPVAVFVDSNGKVISQQQCQPYFYVHEPVITYLVPIQRVDPAPVSLSKMIATNKNGLQPQQVGLSSPHFTSTATMSTGVTRLTEEDDAEWLQLFTAFDALPYIISTEMNSNELQQQNLSYVRRRTGDTSAPPPPPLGTRMGVPLNSNHHDQRYSNNHGQHLFAGLAMASPVTNPPSPATHRQHHPVSMLPTHVNAAYYSPQQVPKAENHGLHAYTGLEAANFVRSRPPTTGILKSSQFSPATTGMMQYSPLCLHSTSRSPSLLNDYGINNRKRPPSTSSRQSTDNYSVRREHHPHYYHHSPARAAAVDNNEWAIPNGWTHDHQIVDGEYRSQPRPYARRRGRRMSRAADDKENDEEANMDKSATTSSIYSGHTLTYQALPVQNVTARHHHVKYKSDSTANSKYGGRKPLAVLPQYHYPSPIPHNLSTAYSPSIPRARYYRSISVSPQEHLTSPQTSPFHQQYAATPASQQRTAPSLQQPPEPPPKPTSMQAVSTSSAMLSASAGSSIYNWPTSTAQQQLSSEQHSISVDNSLLRRAAYLKSIGNFGGAPASSSSTLSGGLIPLAPLDSSDSSPRAGSPLERHPSLSEPSSPVSPTTNTSSHVTTLSESTTVNEQDSGFGSSAKRRPFGPPRSSSIQRLKALFGEKTVRTKAAGGIPGGRASPAGTPTKDNLPSREGRLLVKQNIQDGRRAADRSWKPQWVTLRGQNLYLFRDKHDPTSFSFDDHSINLKWCAVDVLHNYTKRKNVFKVKTFFGQEFYFQAEDLGDMLGWIETIREHNDTIGSSTDAEQMQEMLIQQHLQQYQQQYQDTQSTAATMAATDSAAYPSPASYAAGEGPSKFHQITKKLSMRSLHAGLTSSQQQYVTERTKATPPPLKHSESDQSAILVTSSPSSATPRASGAAGSSSSSKNWRGKMMRNLKKFGVQSSSSPALNVGGLSPPGGGGYESRSSSPPRGSMFGIPLEECPQSVRLPWVPFVVDLCTRLIEVRGLRSQGIYRIPGNASAINNFQKSLDSWPELSALNTDDPRWGDVNVLASLLKRFLIKLPESLVTDELYPSFTDVIQYDEYKRRMSCIKKLLHKLPPANYHTLMHLMNHLSKITAFSSSNKMDAKNLAIAFGPTAIKAPSGTEVDPMVATSNFVEDAQHQCKLVETFINFYEWLFDGREDYHNVPLLKQPSSEALLVWKRSEERIASEESTSDDDSSSPKELLNDMIDKALIAYEAMEKSITERHESPLPSSSLIGSGVSPLHAHSFGSKSQESLFGPPAMYGADRSAHLGRRSSTPTNKDSQVDAYKKLFATGSTRTPHLPSHYHRIPLRAYTQAGGAPSTTSSSELHTSGMLSSVSSSSVEGGGGPGGSSISSPPLSPPVLQQQQQQPMSFAQQLLSSGSISKAPSTQSVRMATVMEDNRSFQQMMARNQQQQAPASALPHYSASSGVASPTKTMPTLLSFEQKSVLNVGHLSSAKQNQPPKTEPPARSATLVIQSGGSKESSLSAAERWHMSQETAIISDSGSNSSKSPSVKRSSSPPAKTMPKESEDESEKTTSSSSSSGSSSAETTSDETPKNTLQPQPQVPVASSTELVVVRRRSVKGKSPPKQQQVTSKSSVPTTIIKEAAHMQHTPSPSPARRASAAESELHRISSSNLVRRYSKEFAALAELNAAHNPDDPQSEHHYPHYYSQDPKSTQVLVRSSGSVVVQTPVRMDTRNTDNSNMPPTPSTQSSSLGESGYAGAGTRRSASIDELLSFPSAVETPSPTMERALSPSVGSARNDSGSISSSAASSDIPPVGNRRHPLEAQSSSGMLLTVPSTRGAARRVTESQHSGGAGTGGGGAASDLSDSGFGTMPKRSPGSSITHGTSTDSLKLDASPSVQSTRSISRVAAGTTAAGGMDSGSETLEDVKDRPQIRLQSPAGTMTSAPCAEESSKSTRPEAASSRKPASEADARKQQPQLQGSTVISSHSTTTTSKRNRKLSEAEIIPPPPSSSTNVTTKVSIASDTDAQQKGSGDSSSSSKQRRLRKQKSGDRRHTVGGLKDFANVKQLLFGRKQSTSISSEAGKEKAQKQSPASGKNVQSVSGGGDDGDTSEGDESSDNDEQATKENHPPKERAEETASVTGSPPKDTSSPSSRASSSVLTHHKRLRPTSSSGNTTSRGEGKKQ